ncbi:hypothetical protein AAE478_000983 [Parahypoxylon ruwenzoriense]
MEQQQQQQYPMDIAVAYREIYRAKFRDDVLAGTKKPFLLPWHLLGVWIVPTLYLAIPHKNRPWLYRARWLVLAFVVVFSFDIIFNVSSHNFGSAYSAGVIGAWGIIWNLTLLVWTKPQWDAKRVDVRRKRRPGQKGDIAKEGLEEKSDSVEASGMELNRHASNSNSQLDGVRERPGYNNTTATLPVEVASISEEKSKILLDITDSSQQHGSRVLSKADLDKLAAEQEFEYYWQEYPADASFWTRLDWSFDIVSTFRMTGWNWAIPCLPAYAPPPTIGGVYQLPLSAAGPHRSAQGFTRSLTRKQLLLSRLLCMLPSYLVIDFCAIHMTADPYFVLGPDRRHPLPPHLSSLPPLVLAVQRIALAFFSLAAALEFIFSAGALALAFLPPLPHILGFRAHPWHLPSVTGSSTQILDRGLAGFWGAWWHQTFHFAFSAPTRWLFRDGGGGNGRSSSPSSRAFRAATGAAVAFLQSGFMHAAGSYSAMPGASKWHLELLFFLLSGAGTVLQSWLSRAIIPRRQSLPRWMRRLGNLAFVTVWLSLTSWAIIDDFSRCGLWLFEPVPFSVFRALGYGPTRDRRVWRYEAEFWLRWYRGKHWWDTGIAI